MSKVDSKLRRHDRRTREGKLGLIQLRLRIMSESLARIMSEMCRELDVIDKQLEELIAPPPQKKRGKSQHILPFTQSK